MSRRGEYEVSTDPGRLMEIVRPDIYLQGAAQSNEDPPTRP